MEGYIQTQYEKVSRLIGALVSRPGRVAWGTPVPKKYPTFTSWR